MMEKAENKVKGKKQYVSIWVETLTLETTDIVTASNDPQADNDITKDDIFG
jgi:hypothetical protein